MDARIHPAYPLDVSNREALSHIFRALPSLVKLLYRLMKDTGVPLSVKIWIGGTALYVISPINLKLGRNRIMPLKILNILDDVILVLLTLQKTFQQTPFEILQKYWDYSMPMDQWNDLVFKLYTDLKNSV